MTGGYVFQSDAARYFGGYAYFLADAVHQVELHFGEKYGQRNSRESAPCAQVHDFRTRGEADYFGYAQGVENVVFVQVSDIFT